MGVVWEARDERLNRMVAVKQLRTQPGATEAETDLITQRAMREARINAQLQHPYAVAVFDVVDHEDRPCIVMELVPSEPLTAVLRELGTLDPAEAARVGAQAGSALAAAHVLGIVHRDVKPGNILVGEDGTARICDFGISRSFGDTTLTMTGMITGTPAYLAPEAARGEESTFASDVFSLGATLYAAVEGVPPFGAEGNAMAVLYRVVAGELRPPERAGELGQLLVAMMSPSAEDRPTMAEAAAQLARLADGDGGSSAAGLGAADPGAGSLTTPDRTRRLPTPTEAVPAAPAAPATATTREVATEVAAEVAPEPAAEAALPDQPGPGSPPTPVLPRRSAPHVEGPPAGAPPAASPGASTGASAGASAGAPPGSSARASAGARPSASAGASPGAEVRPVEPRVDASTSRRRQGLLIGVVVALVVGAIAVVVLSLGDGFGGDDPGAGATSPSATGQGSPSPQSSVSPSGSEPTAAELAQAVAGYYGLLPDGTDAGWELLTPSYQQQAGGRDSYDNFWNDIDTVTVSNVSATVPDQVQATITYVLKSGNERSTERRSFELVESEGVLKINRSSVI